MGTRIIQVDVTDRRPVPNVIPKRSFGPWERFLQDHERFVHYSTEAAIELIHELERISRERSQQQFAATEEDKQSAGPGCIFDTMADLLKQKEGCLNNTKDNSSETAERDEQWIKMLNCIISAPKGRNKKFPILSPKTSFRMLHHISNCPDDEKDLIEVRQLFWSDILKYIQENMRG